MSDLPSIANRITKLRELFIRHERFDPLEQRFTLLMQKRLADIAADRVSEAHGIALSGASGTGKSCAVAHLISRTRTKFSDQGISDGALISLRVPSPATLKFMGQMVLRALGYNLAAERQAWYIWDLVRHQLRERQVLFLHLDEAQDLSSRGTKHELNSVASMLKTLMTDEDWPVGILLSGTSELEGILNHDPQLARRMGNIRFDPLSERLIHAAAFQFGLVIEIIIAAIEAAYLEGSTALGNRHFADAFSIRTANLEAFNPFIVDDYHRIDARRVFGREGDHDACN